MVVKLPEDDCTSEDMSPAPSSSSPELLAGYLPPSTTEEARFAISHSQYLNDRPAKTFGTSNPTLMNKPFWKYMIQQHLRDSDDGGAYSARKHFEPGVEIVFETFGEPVWCFQRYGQTKTKLPDGRWILVGENMRTGTIRIFVFITVNFSSCAVRLGQLVQLLILSNS